MIQLTFPFYQFLSFIYGESVMKLKTITITHNPNKEFTHSFTLSSISTILSFILIPFSPTFLSPNHISFTLKSKQPLNDGGERDEMMMLRNDWRRNWSLRWSYEHHEMINETSEPLSSRIIFFMTSMSFILL